MVLEAIKNRVVGLFRIAITSFKKALTGPEVDINNTLQTEDKCEPERNKHYLPEEPSTDLETSIKSDGIIFEASEDSDSSFPKDEPYANNYIAIAEAWVLDKEKYGIINFQRTNSIKDAYRRLMGWMSRCKNQGKYINDAYSSIETYLASAQFRKAYIIFCSLMTDDFGRVHDRNDDCYIHNGFPFQSGIPLKWFDRDNYIAVNHNGCHVKIAVSNISYKQENTTTECYSLKPTIDINLLKELTYGEREIIKLKNGLGSTHKHKYEEIGRIFRMPMVKVCEIEERALKKLTELQGESGMPPSQKLS